VLLVQHAFCCQSRLWSGVFSCLVWVALGGGVGGGNLVMHTNLDLHTNLNPSPNGHTR
jgi:hypothetical protein